MQDKIKPAAGIAVALRVPLIGSLYLVASGLFFSIPMAS